MPGSIEADFFLANFARVLKLDLCGLHILMLLTHFIHSYITHFLQIFKEFKKPLVEQMISIDFIITHISKYRILRLFQKNNHAIRAILLTMLIADLSPIAQLCVLSLTFQTYANLTMSKFGARMPIYAHCFFKKTYSL